MHFVLLLHVEFNVLHLDLHRVSLAVKSLLRPFRLPFSPLRSLLSSEDLASSSWKFDLLVHTRLSDAGIVDFNVLEFKFTGTPPWTFPRVRICLFLSKLVKSSHFLADLRCSALEHARVHAPSVPMGPSLVRVWAVPLFFLTLTYSSLFL